MSRIWLKRPRPGQTRWDAFKENLVTLLSGLLLLGACILISSALTRLVFPFIPRMALGGVVSGGAFGILLGSIAGLAWQQALIQKNMSPAASVRLGLAVLSGSLAGWFVSAGAILLLLLATSGTL